MNRKRKPSRRGIVLMLTAVLLVVLVGMVGFAVDIGYGVLSRTQLQVAADAGALAGAGASLNGTAAVREAQSLACRQFAAGDRVHLSQVEVQLGNWDDGTRTFEPSQSQYSAVKVIVRGKSSLFFGRVFGKDSLDSKAEAVATFAPRDILLVLDYSASMSYDSQLYSIDALGRATVEANLRNVYNDLGAPQFGSMQWQPVAVSGNATQIKQTLGLTSVAYPYAGDSWDCYISYVQSNQNLHKAGYRGKYGYLTWVDYLQSQRCRASQTPDLWKTREQPIGAVKDAVDLLVGYLNENCLNDRLGFALYTSADGEAVLESPMTNDFCHVADLVRHRQAGHYDSLTNISAGMATARQEFERNGRRGACKVMVVMTDGQANLPGNTGLARKRVLEEAQAAKAAKINVVTIALGSDADTSMMQEIADITGGVSFVIAGGRSVSDYEDALRDIFWKIAADRKPRLVQ